MPTYCAFLGHQPHISLAELCVLLPDLAVTRQWNSQIITFETKAELDAEWLSTVGGTVLVAREVLERPADKKRESSRRKGGADALATIVPPLLSQGLQGVKRKATFSFRCFGIPRPEIRALYRICKQYLKAKGIPSRYIGNERNPAKPGTLLLRGIPGPGTSELVILHNEESEVVWIGATCAVQDIAAYTQRDMGKPYRDMRTGLLPPKLAQVMLNLALLTLPQAGSGKREAGSDWSGVTVWDPFSGSGVIGMEALLRRAHVLASDRSERAVRGCRENLRWLREKAKIPRTVTHEVWKGNALKPQEFPRAPTLIVTETSLGPALRGAATKREVSAFLREAEELELGFFTALASALPTLPVTCTFPVYLTRDGQRHFLPTILEKIAKLGYRQTLPGNKLIRTTSRHSLLYLRPDQWVGREILCFLPPRRPPASSRARS